MTADPKRLEVYADTKHTTVCRGPKCRRRITWYTLVESRKKMCFSGNPIAVREHRDLTDRLIWALPFEENHWATCPDRALFTKPKGAPNGPANRRR